jgi:drug/metabolite transporter (DMT)-like permease
MLASIVSWTVYSLITKKISAKYSGIKVTAIQSMIALVLFVPTLLVTDFPDFAAFSVGNWANLLFLGVICSGVCYYLYIHSVNVLGVIIPNMFLNFIPLITILVNVLFFQADIDLFQIIGGVIITGSMTMMTVDNLKAARQA